jgi:pimeloyl-ACP methyl ester carboxylesterase
VVRRSRTLGIALLIVSTLAACQAGSGSNAPAASTIPSPSSTRSVAPTPEEEVELTAADGRRLRARLWSTGSVGVVLAHGFSQTTGQDSWDRFAPYLRDQGYGVLTFDFRGFCDRDGCSERPMQLGENWRDVVAAVEYLQSVGSEQVFVIAASMGGLAAFRAADEADLDVAGIVSLSTPQFPSRYYHGEPPENDVTPERLQRIDAPKLFIAGTDDVQLPGEAPIKPGIESVRFADDAQAMFDAAPEPRQIELVDSGHHSSELVTIADRQIVEQTRQIIVAFMEEHA